MIDIRPLTKHSEYYEAVHLQRLIWSWQEVDLIPVRFFVVAREIGGQIFGAFDDDSMAGFLLAGTMAGIRWAGMRSRLHGAGAAPTSPTGTR